MEQQSLRATTTEPTHQSPQATMPEPASCSHEALEPGLCSSAGEAAAMRGQSRATAEEPLLAVTRESPHTATEIQHGQKYNK